VSAPETPPEGDAPEAAGGSWFTVARIGATVFAVLAVATVAAFFVAQKLKTAPTVIAHVTPSTVFSPPLGPLELGFGIKEDDTLTVEVVNDQGDVVRTLVDDRHQPAYTNVKLRWDGTDDDGHRVPDGAYKVRVLLRDRGRTIELPATYTVDATPPRPVVLRTGPRSAGATGPEILPLPGGGDATVRFRAPGSHRQLVVFRTGGPGAPAEVLREDVPRTMRTWRWDGKVHGRYVPVGAYVVVAESRDRAGNLGSSIPLTRAGLPQEAYARPFPGRGGITVRHVGIQPPLTPVTAGHRAAIGVDARGQRYRWALGLPGEQAGRRGTTRGTPLRVPTPGGFSGLYRLTVTSGRTTARSFVPVQGARKHPVLVVLPATTWQGRNPVDDDGDGRPDTLEAGLPTRLHRVFAGDGLPAGYAAETEPLLRALDAAKLRYDLTTDVALAQGTGPTLAGHRGAILAGTARWLPTQVAARLKAWVRDGGRLASFGRGALQRYVTVAPATGVATKPTQAETTDLFAIEPQAPVAKPTELISADDRIGLFAQTDGQFGPLAGAGRFAPPPARAVLAQAVDPDGTPSILATRYGRGEVLRFPLPTLPARLAPDPELAQVVRNAWTVLSR